MQSVNIGFYNEFGNDILDALKELSLISLSATILREEINNLSLIVDQRPTFVVVDPYFKPLDKNRAYNEGVVAIN